MYFFPFLLLFFYYAFAICNSLTLEDSLLRLDTHWSNQTTSRLCKERWETFEKSCGRNAEGTDNKNNDGRIVRKSNTKKILLVHVGKTGGETVMMHYFANLTNLHAQQIHVHALDHQMVQDFNIIVLSLRNPVDRLISAYRWSHPLVEGSHAQMKEQSMNSFYTCCPTLQKFGDTLFEVNKTHCGTIARSQSARYQLLKGHMNLDSCAYLRGVLASLKRMKKRVFIINTETMEEDFYRIAKSQRWRVHHEDNYAPFFGHALNHNNFVVSNLTRQQLTTFLELTGEIDMYNTLQAEFKK